MFIVYFLIGAFMLLSKWKIFTKANVPGWVCLIPFYSTFKLFEITVGNGWKMLYCLIPFFGPVYAIYVTCVKLSQVFGHKAGFTLGLFFLPHIFMLIIGLGSSEYLGVTDAESTESLASLYLLGGIMLILSVPTMAFLFKTGIGLLAATFGVSGVVLLIIGISGLLAVRYETKRAKCLEG